MPLASRFVGSLLTQSGLASTAALSALARRGLALISRAAALGLCGPMLRGGCDVALSSGCYPSRGGCDVALSPRRYPPRRGRDMSLRLG